MTRAELEVLLLPIGQGMERAHAKLDQLGEKLDHVDQRVDAHDTMLARLDERSKKWNGGNGRYAAGRGNGLPGRAGAGNGWQAASKPAVAGAGFTGALWAIMEIVQALLAASP